MQNFALIQKASWLPYSHADTVTVNKCVLYLIQEVREAWVALYERQRAIEDRSSLRAWASEHRGYHEYDAALEQQRVENDIADQIQSDKMSIMARSFLFSFDNFRMHAKALAKHVTQIKTKEDGSRIDTSGEASLINTALNELDKEVPDIQAVRDSTHHMDERGHLKKKHGKDIFSASNPQPPVVLLGVQVGDSIRHLSPDGAHSSFSVSEESLNSLVKTCQKILNALPWEGGIPIPRSIP